MARFPIFGLTLTLLVACTGGGKEGDGPGTDPDPQELDADGDGLTDAEEEALGTDPEEVDSDEDSYQDGWEVDAGTDPTDPESRIYQGYWPYNPDKDSIEDPGLDSDPKVGETFARVILTDLYGDQLDLYDFAGHDAPIILELGTGWCVGCKHFANWLSGQPSYMDSFSDEDWYTEFPELVRQGRISWITILSENSRSQPADGDTLQDWHDDYPNDQVALMMDPEESVGTYLETTDFPEILWLDSDMTLNYRWDTVENLEPVIEEILAEL